ncbi:MAG: tetratricopeptide repeat protein [Bacteroidota bacterium]
MGIVQGLKENYPDSSYTFIEKGLQMANQANDQKGIIDLLILRGGYYWRKSNYIPAIEDYNQALLLSRNGGYGPGVWRSLTNLGLVYSKLGDYPRAIEFFLNGIALGDSIHIGNSAIYNSLAVAYRRNNNLDQAIDALQESIRLMNTPDKNLAPGLAGGVYVNLGNIFMDKGDADKAMFYQKKALHIFDSLHQNRGTVTCYNNISELLIRQKKFAEALTWSQKSLALSQSNGLTANEASALGNIASIASATGDDHKAIGYLTRAIALTEASQDKVQLIRLYSLMAHSSESVGRNDQALLYLKKYTVAKDSTFNEEANTKMTNLRVGFEINKREIDKRVFQQEREIHVLNRNILIGLVTALLIILLILGFYQYIRIKKNKLLLAQMEVIHQARQQLLQTDLENQKLKQEELQREVERKSMELTTHALNLIRKNEILEEIKEGLTDINIDIGIQPEVKKDIRKLVNSINLSHHQDKEWLAFKTHFEKIHTGFFEKLQQEYPDLSGNDIKICSLVS